MPVYEYYCGTCNDTFEKRQSMSVSSDAVTCTHGHKARKMLSVIAPVAKGNHGHDSMPMGMPEGCCSPAEMAQACGGGACGTGMNMN